MDENFLPLVPLSEEAVRLSEMASDRRRALQDVNATIDRLAKLSALARA